LRQRHRLVSADKLHTLKGKSRAIAICIAAGPTGLREMRGNTSSKRHG